jgi:hypothetical protein
MENEKLLEELEGGEGGEGHILFEDDPLFGKREIVFYEPLSEKGKFRKNIYLHSKAKELKIEGDPEELEKVTIQVEDEPEEKSDSGKEIIIGIAVIGILLLFFKNIS